MTSSGSEGKISSILSEEEVKSSLDKKFYSSKYLVTLGVLTVYTLFMSIPLIGADLGEGDPLATIRIITASLYGSLAELGILPLVTAGLVMYSLLKLNLYKLDITNQGEQNRYNIWRIILSCVITVGMALILLVSGVYGADLDFFTQIGLVIQLTIAGGLIILLNEIIKREWGFGSGISIFLAGSIGIRVIQGFIAPNNILEGANHVTSARGIMFAFFYWAGEEGPLSAIGHLFFRFSTDPRLNLNLPALSLLSVYLACLFFVIVVIFETIQLKMNTKTTFKSLRKLGYSPVIPIVWTTTIFALIRFLSIFIWNASGRENSTSILTGILGQYQLDPMIEHYVPIGGLAYFVSPPPAIIAGLMFDPVATLFHGIIYGALFLGLYRSCTKMMVQIDALNTLNPQEIRIDRPWLLIGIICVISDLLNLLAVGLGIVVLALILVNFYQRVKYKRSIGFVRFDLESREPQKSSPIGGKQLTRNRFVIMILLVGLGQFILRFLVFVILGRDI